MWVEFSVPSFRKTLLEKFILGRWSTPAEQEHQVQMSLNNTDVIGLMLFYTPFKYHTGTKTE